MRNLIGKHELLEMLQIWELKIEKLIYESNRNIDEEMTLQLRAIAKCISECAQDLYCKLKSK